MGKGDRKSRRGKIFRGTYGKRRPRKKKVAKNSGK
ncbi:MAG TPA: 30S ribosomal protein THX [Gemmatimonadales bacterium]|jgi:30S ribosomal protein S31